MKDHFQVATPHKHQHQEVDKDNMCSSATNKAPSSYSADDSHQVLGAPTRGLRSLGRRYEVSGFRSKVSSTRAHIRGATKVLGRSKVK